MSSPKNRYDLQDALLTAGREGSTLTVMFHTAIAERLGLSVSDYKTLDLIVREGPLTAGKLGELTGLTTGAVTGLIDRLERAGLVRRKRDERDRRKVIVQPTVGELEKDVLPMFGSFGAALDELYASYGDEELLTILDYTTRLNDLLREEIKKLRERMEGEEQPVKKA
jgi:DNA-binding MarR family transcriptional regulator